MKLTIESTDPAMITRRVVTIELPGDDYTMPEVVENLLKPALLAWGFHPDMVGEAFGDE